MVGTHLGLNARGNGSGSARLIDTLISQRSKHALAWFDVCITDKHTLLVGVGDMLCNGTGFKYSTDTFF